LKVNLLSLGTGVASPFEARYDANTLDLNTQDVELIEPLLLTGELEKAEGILTVRASAVSRCREVCSRCLAKIEGGFKKELHLTLLISNDQRVCDFTPELREEILLSHPVKFLCNENCKGLCGHCGTNLNVSSCECSPTAPKEGPFQILKKLKFKKKSK
jgi:uncharacterized protein